MERITFNQIPKGMMENMMATENYINNSSLGYQLLELVRLRIAQINKCAYCIDMHYKELKHSGETELRISTLSVWKETSFFTEKEKAILLFTEALTEISKNDISEEIYHGLTTFFTTAEICNLALAISQINTWTRLMRTFGSTAGNYEVTK
ncbi:MAG: AhpD family alkylhydroperoxidase [Crocinitomix sp.]|jgi:AhpD family alkylhydroperoxidase